MSSPIKYFINERDGIVVASVNELRDTYFEMLLKADFPVYEAKWRNLMDFLPNKLSAVARCADTDEFDENIGVAYARARLIIKIERAKRRLYNEMVKAQAVAMMRTLNLETKSKEIHNAQIEKLISLDEKNS